MKRTIPVIGSLTLLAGLSASMAQAHHSTNGIYDESEVVELSGVVKAWRFVNPHPSLLLEVEAEDGAIQEWDVSYGGAAVTHLRDRGYTEDSFRPGDAIVVRGFAARVRSAFGLLVRGDPLDEDGVPVVASQR